MTFRTFLFVPGNRPERFEKALATGADAVCIDLEDAVAPGDKAQARGAVLAYLAARTPSGAKVGVRVNGVRTPEGPDDAKALSGAGADFVMVPKADAPADLAAVRAAQGAAAPPLWPIVESAEAVRNAWDIAAAPGVAGVLFGGADYAADLGCTLGWDALLFARGTLAAACARAGVELLDVPHFDVRDLDDLRASTLRAKAMGFTGRACIHPDQVEPVAAVFAPTAEELERARRVCAAFDAAGGAAALLDGKLIELPVIRAARRVLDSARP
jgi:citrate lyase subunit beta/citryl-CoA lyase/(S)-citramalyl-CoA lyase